MNKIDYLNKYMNKYNYNLKTNNYKSNKVTIFISNHTCIRESLFVAKILNNNIVFTTSSNSVYKKAYKEKILNNSLYLLPLELYGSKKYFDIYLDKLINLLKENINIIFFPEGVYTRDGNINRAHTGVSRLIIKALENNIDFNVVPIYTKITDNKDKASLDLNNENVEITFLKELDLKNILDEYNKSDNKNEILHKIVDSAMKEIAKYGNIEYKCKYRNYVSKKRLFILDGKYVNKNILLSNKYFNKYSKDLEKRTYYIIKKYKENL